MLEELEIRALGPIRQARLTPHPGMNAITGETGAGKSMLLNAVELISGAQAQPSRVSPDSEQAWVQAIFDVDKDTDIQELAASAGSECADGQLFINRSVPKNGRSRAVLNGHSVPRTVLTNIATQLVTIHGQSEQLTIAHSARQREFLDSFAGNNEQKQTYISAFNHYTRIKDKLEKLHNAQSEAIAQIDYLKDAISRIESIDPHVGEDEDLKSQRDYIENAAEIAVAQASALSALDGSDDDNGNESVTELISRAIHSLRDVESIEQMADIISRLESVSDEVQDIVYALSQLGDDEVNPQDLDRINERIHDLDELSKRWGPTLEDVLEWKQKAQFELEDLDASPQRIHELEEQVEQAHKIAQDAAKELTQTRVKASHELAEKVTQELASLAMEGSELRISITNRDLDITGADNVAFEFVPFPGSSALPLGKSASGGELSRLMLALELVAFENKHGQGQENYSVPTLIFDEIDAGVGGKAAAELGKRLALLARGAQIIVVTHLPQVAAWADRQFVVSKEKTDDNATTTVSLVEGNQRVEEIARMLSGSQSDMSLQHAAELLEECTLS
ncbi:DNA repair protein RecN [Alloscardovia theropitheci]|uniref:DNA repair protein RecN n=1 Tax=Alloscardovia theropitheci TaxID=2496842 RepID=A0A4R0QQH6_9BIFI|nr:DNA repair protein RecN [Alloscardovia theropitheci]TCD53568.1 DNA repair protein RecN [Alloscardovia theropitheci]